jgi:hypothetical protein
VLFCQRTYQQRQLWFLPLTMLFWLICKCLTWIWTWTRRQSSCRGQYTVNDESWDIWWWLSSIFCAQSTWEYAWTMMRFWSAQIEVRRRRRKWECVCACERKIHVESSKEKRIGCFSFFLRVTPRVKKKNEQTNERTNEMSLMIHSFTV